MDGIMLNLSTLGLTLLVAVFLIVAYGVYNVFLHPCSSFPGPKAWAAYRLPYVLATCRGRLPQTALEFHRMYGPVVRIAPNELSFTDPQAWTDIQGIQSGRRQNTKEPLSYGPDGESQDGIILATDEQHARLRRIYGPAFTPKAVEEQSSMLMKYANQLVSTLKNNIKTNPVQDMSALYNAATFDFTGEFAFDESFHCLEKGGTSHFFMEIVLKGVIAGLMICQLERYGIWQALKPVLPRSLFKDKHQLDEYTTALVDKRSERGFIPGKTDVFNYLLQKKNDNDRATRAELINNSLTLVVAGSETTATLLSGATWLLAKNQDCYRKAVDEVRTAFKSDDEITQKSVNNLQYMIAVLDESMRVFPPTAFSFPRIITAKEGQSVAGVHVPYRTRAGVFHWAASHTSNNFARPAEFIPERWLPDPPVEFINDRKDAVQVFHVGPRACLGKNLAFAEMRLLFAKMLWHFDFELAASGRDWADRLGAYTVWHRTSLDVKLTSVRR